MAKMTKAQARRRLDECSNKLFKVWEWSRKSKNPNVLSTNDMNAIDKILTRAFSKIDR